MRLRCVQEVYICLVFEQKSVVDQDWPSQLFICHHHHHHADGVALGQ